MWSQVLSWWVRWPAVAGGGETLLANQSGKIAKQVFRVKN